MNIAFVIRSLHVGGAERQLVALAAGLHARGHQVQVHTLYDDGPLAADLRAAGVPIVSAQKRGRWDIIGFFARFITALRRQRPDVVHGYLAGPNILSVLARPLLPSARIVWGVRASFVDLRQYGRFTRLAYRIERLLSRQADLIICNSYAGRDHAVAQGFPAQKLVVVANGINTARFRPDPAAGARMRQQWDIAADQRVIGLVARLDPMKDHPTFFRAAAKISRTQTNLQFVCIGNGSAEYRRQLQAAARTHGLCDQLHWVANEADMPAAYNALDITVLSSAYGEGFPNVVGEAMACSVPCVVTDVGDAAHVVGDTGIVVPHGDAAALAAGLTQMLQADRAELGKQARQRINDQFSLDQLVDQTESILWPKA